MPRRLQRNKTFSENHKRCQACSVKTSTYITVALTPEEIFLYLNKHTVVCCKGSIQIQIEIQKLGVLPIWKIMSNVSSVGPSSERNFVHVSL